MRGLSAKKPMYTYYNIKNPDKILELFPCLEVVAFCMSSVKQVESQKVSQIFSIITRDKGEWKWKGGVQEVISASVSLGRRGRGGSF
jgi:hypothetical protein